MAGETRLDQSGRCFHAGLRLDFLGRRKFGSPLTRATIRGTQSTMCGLSGFWSADPIDDAPAVLRRMADAIRHRGPDDEGYWWDGDSGLGFAFRRLSILDLSPKGHQPMVSASGRYVVVFNGEIYNVQDLRRTEEAHGACFEGHSDTEVMLAAIERRGLHSAVESFHGMFALALWDRATRTLHLVRDRLGEKPLYYGWMGRTLLFGSELKALRAHPAWRGDIDRDALGLMLRYSYVPGPYSIYRGVRKVAPATIESFHAGEPGLAPEVTRYWSVRADAEAAFHRLRPTRRTLSSTSSTGSFAVRCATR